MSALASSGKTSRFLALQELPVFNKRRGAFVTVHSRYDPWHKDAVASNLLR
jgi:hypothetical protein